MNMAMRKYEGGDATITQQTGQVSLNHLEEELLSYIKKIRCSQTTATAIGPVAVLH